MSAQVIQFPKQPGTPSLESIARTENIKKLKANLDRLQALHKKLHKMIEDLGETV